MGEKNYKLGSGARGLTSQSRQIMKAFLSDQEGGGGGASREEDRRRGGWMDGWVVRGSVWLRCRYTCRSSHEGGYPSLLASAELTLSGTCITLSNVFFKTCARSGVLTCQEMDNAGNWPSSQIT